MFDWRGKKAKINGLPLELQGFSHHPSFAGMGAMTNPRLGLFLVQTTKALGVNCKQRHPQLIVACTRMHRTLTSAVFASLAQLPQPVRGQPV